ncbi:MAG: hypothetical protein ACYCU0_06510 [Solirubrobacteraceae bacterium]
MARTSRWRSAEPAIAARRRGALRPFAATLLLASLCSATIAGGAQAASSSARPARTGGARSITRLRGQIAPALLRLTRSKRLSGADPRQPVTIAVTLRRSRQAAFAEYLRRSTIPGRRGTTAT